MATPSLPILNHNILPQIKQEPMLPAEAIFAQMDSSIQPQRDHDQEEEKPQFLKSVKALVSLSSAINAFQSRFEDLQSHLDSIRNSMDAQFKVHHHPMSTRIETETKGTVSKENGGETCENAETWRSELRYLCETMSSRELRKLITGQLPNLSLLREEILAALKLAPRPAKLVSECIGRFYLQGKKAYSKGSHMIASRRAAVLILECFLSFLGSCAEGKIDMDESLKSEMQDGAIAWRKRLVTEGGLARASEMDARGLLLLIICFGIPAVFKGEDIGHLLRLCNMRENSDALKGSPVLLAKMPDIMESMAKNNFHVEAIDVVCSLGIEDKHPPQEILTMALQESKESRKKAKQDAKTPPIALKQLNEKQLAVLKSAVKYVEDRSWDLAKLFGGWGIREKIFKLEKEIADLDKQIEDKATPKRKPDKTGSSSKVNGQETKRLRVGAKEPLLLASHMTGFHERRTAAFANAMRSHEAIAPNPLDVGISSRIYGYPSHATAHGEIGVDKAPQMMRSAVDVADAALVERYLRQSSGANPLSTVAGGLYRPSQGFVGLPEYSSASNLYRFADVVDAESYGSGSRVPSAAAPSLPAYHRPYMH